jgi:hypothetical protein
MSFTNSFMTLGGTKTTNYNINRKLSPSLEWIEQTSLGIKLWVRVSSSENNDVLIAGVQSGYFYVSNDSGNNWIEYALKMSVWDAVCVSGNGNVLIAGGNGVGSSGGSYATSPQSASELYISRDSGNTFSIISDLSPTKNWQASCCSYDGTHIYACAHNTFIYISNDNGNTWITRQSQRLWSGIGTSHDGSKVCACVYNNYIYVSLDYGNTWTSKLTTTNKFYQDVVVSPNGNNFFVMDVNSGTYSFTTSSNSGTSWILRSNGGYPVSSSFTGNKIIGFRGGNGFIQISTNLGQSWTEMTNFYRGDPWKTGSMSSDGTKLIAGVYGGYIYLITGL